MKDVYKCCVGGKVLAVGGEEGLVAILDIAARSVLTRSQTVFELHYPLSLNRVSTFSTVSPVFFDLYYPLIDKSKDRLSSIMQCCGSASKRCRSRSRSNLPFWCRSKSGPGSCWKIIYFFYFYSPQFILFYLSRQHHKCHNFQYFGKYLLKFSLKKYSFAV